MDVPYVIKRRLEELNLEQKELALAAQVTESYISQLLTRKKAPPASHRTDIYEKIEGFLELPTGELATLADFQRMETLRRAQGGEPVPLFEEVRQLLLRKCHPDRVEQVRAIFEKQPFGELERLVTHNLMAVVKRVAREELKDEARLRKVARLSHMEYEEMRVRVLEFLDTDSFHVSVEGSALFLNPLVDSWDIDLETFAIEVFLNRRVVSDPIRRLEFTARASVQAYVEEPGLLGFLDDPALSRTATEEEIGFLRRLEFKDRRPTPLYYYRELQNLRDPLHFD